MAARMRLLEDWDDLESQGRPGLMQGGSRGLPLPGGLDYDADASPFPTYLGPDGERGTDPYLPYTPPAVENVGITSFDEIDHGIYGDQLERLFPERLEDPYAGWGEDHFDPLGTDGLAPPSSTFDPGENGGGGGGGGSGPASRAYNEQDLDALLFDLKRNPASSASGIIKDYAQSHDIDDWKSFRNAAYGYVEDHGSALGDLYVEDEMRGGNQ